VLAPAVFVGPDDWSLMLPDGSPLSNYISPSELQAFRPSCLPAAPKAGRPFADFLS